MARLGIVGDIHANREALGQALAALRRAGAERLLCLGDIVGINASPNECVEMVAASAPACIAGNHDLLAVGLLSGVPRLNQAAFAIRRTRNDLTAQSAAYLAGLPRELWLADHGVLMVHGGVGDPQRYLYAPDDVAREAAVLRGSRPDAWICLFGHSHQQKVYEIDGDGVRDLPGHRIRLRRERTYFINPGAVDGSMRRSHGDAELAILDTDRCEVELLRVPYDRRATEEEARSRGYRIGPLMDWCYSRRRQARQVAELVRRRGVLGAARRLLRRVAGPAVMFAAVMLALPGCLLDWGESGGSPADLGPGERPPRGIEAAVTGGDTPAEDAAYAGDLALDSPPRPDTVASDLARSDRASAGGLCSTDDQCASGYCREGVCCSGPCVSACASCALPGTEGSCLPLPAGAAPPPGKSCSPVTAVADCGLDGLCDGTGACQFWAAGTACKPSKCVGKSDQIELGASCNGMGQCVSKGKASCAPYTCDAVFAVCRESCSSSSQCSAGFQCVGSQCVP